jgi:hypothetical protein
LKVVTDDGAAELATTLLVIMVEPMLELAPEGALELVGAGAATYTVVVVGDVSVVVTVVRDGSAGAAEEEEEEEEDDELEAAPT